jgi:peptidyl serine alpha-galactosyltransferase
MYRIALKWSDFAVPVHDQYPHLLAEMFAYCLAAAHLKLSHQTATSFMVSDVGIGAREGWNYVDRLANDEVCSPKSIEDLPNVIHFCQRYGAGPYFFGKRKLPAEFLTCESPLLMETPKSFESDHIQFPDGQTKKFPPQEMKRHRFVLCNLIPAVNAAASYYKRKHCDSKANFEKTLAFNTNMDT